jgi:4-amino-4-deoxy-L-arabinose transferase-like glycosyltransferase
MSDTSLSESAQRETWSAEPAKIPPARARFALNTTGTLLVLLDMLLRVASRGETVIPVILWGTAAACFVGSFVLLMSQSGETPTQARSPGPSPALPADIKAPEADGSNGSTHGTDADEPPLIRRGNPLHLVRGGIPAVLASLVTVILMGRDGHLSWGVPLGALLVAIASWGIMDLLGTFDDASHRIVKSVTLSAVAGRLAAFAASWVAFSYALGLATAGRGLPQSVWGLLVTATFIGFVVATFTLGRALGIWTQDETGVDRGLWMRHGFWLVVIGAVLYFPMMGTSSLWDPWETHYGEVAREMLAKDDWISLWWAQDGWFWSKPVLDMWLQAIAMATLGVHYQPGQMLIGNGAQPLMHPEWAVRAPIVLLTILALYLLYKGVSTTFGRRAAFLGGVVLATTPDFYLLAHQTMTDMPFVAAMTSCLGLVLLGLRTPDAVETRAYEVTLGNRRLRLTGWHLVFGVILVSALPQILYLLSRNFQFVWGADGHGFRDHWDEFRSGSGMGNCGEPGNEDCRTTLPAFIPRIAGDPNAAMNLIWRAVGAFEPAVQALVWTLALGVVLYMSWGERRIKRLFYLAAWSFAGASTLAKGPAGFGLPVLVTFAYLVASEPREGMITRIERVFREIVKLEVVAGLLVLAAVSLPWYVAMYVRHGAQFTDRLFIHDMFNRAFSHVHDTNEGDDTSFRFYVWQLGYALFPWTGLAPLGLTWWLRRGTSKRDKDRADTGILLCMWFLFSFALFSFMGTKFHHYIFPAVPAVAMLIGLAIDDMMGEKNVATATKWPAYVGGLVVGSAGMVLGMSLTQPGSFLGTKPGGHLPNASPVLGLVLLLAGAALTVVTIWRFGNQPVSRSDEEPEPAHASRMLAAGTVCAALVLVIVTRDLVIKPEGADQPGAIRLLQLFTYNYRRAWPDSLDFAAPLFAFGAVAILFSLALGVRAVRPHAVAAMCAFAFVWGLWGLDVYMQRTAQHWGQHEIIAAYYADRQSPSETLVAYQMNWKGENFYTGNQVPAFVSTGSTFTSWLKKQRDAGTKVMYFITEQGRIGGLKNEVAAKAYREVTDRVLCNKFVLVRAEL